MTDTTDSERFEAAITTMREYFGGRPASTNIKRFYWDALKRFGINAIESGFRQYMLDANAWPKVVDIVPYVSRGAGGETKTTFSHFCEFDFQGQRCQNPGANSESTTGGGPWYCGVHFRERSGAAAIRELELSRFGSLEKPQGEKLDWLDKNFPRHEGESDRDYAMRCKTFALTGMKTFTLKRVV